MATTTNMALTLPVVSSTIGPTWATMVNAAFESIDSHDHTSGKGVKVPTGGLNINADLPFSNYLATGLKGTQFNSQASALTTLNCVHVAGGNLWFTNASGAQVQITSGGSVNAGSTGNILGLSSPAQAAYVLGTLQFSWYSNAAANQLASMRQAESVYHAAGLTTNNSVTVKTPAALAASYTLTLPAAVPAARGFLVSATSGAQDYSYVDNSTIEDSSGTVRVKDLGITTAKIANGGGVNGATGITPEKLSPGFWYYNENSTVTLTNTSFAAQATLSNIALKAGVWLLTIQPCTSVSWSDWWVIGTNNNVHLLVEIKDSAGTVRFFYEWVGAYLANEKIRFTISIQDRWESAWPAPASIVFSTRCVSGSYQRGPFSLIVTQGG